MNGPDHGMAAGDDRGRLRASHADRERVIGTLKAAYVYGLATRDEFDERVSQTFAARTCAELAVVTADIPPGLALAAPPRPAPSASAPAAARDRVIMAAAMVAGLALVASVLVSPLAVPGVSLAGTLGALLFLGGAGSGLVSLFLLGTQLRSQRTKRPGSQLPPGRRADCGPSAAHRAISATPAKSAGRPSWPPGPGTGGQDGVHHRSSWREHQAGSASRPRSGWVMTP